MGRFRWPKKEAFADRQVQKWQRHQDYAVIDGNGTLCGNMIESASPRELAEPLLVKRLIRRGPKKSIYDKAANSDRFVPDFSNAEWT